MSESSNTTTLSAHAAANRDAVRILLRLEAMAVLAVACLVYAALHASWASFALLFLLPDLSMLGYLVGPRLGAACYNCGHSYAAPAALAMIGHAFGAATLFPLALIWLAHIGFDRMLGYGLKYPTGFGDTHLGRIGRSDFRTVISRGSTASSGSPRA